MNASNIVRSIQVLTTVCLWGCTCSSSFLRLVWRCFYVFL